MNTTHPPGPYPLAIIPGNQIIVITNQKTHYATTHDPAAARLIAAAPELLAALQALIIPARKQFDLSPTVDGLANCDLLAAACAALAKAAGNTP